MDSASNQAEPNYFIPEWIKLEFYNNSNLKNDIQNRISKTIGTTFIEALKNIKGDNINNHGTSFSEITLLALAYFYSEIFKDKIDNEFYTLEMAKGLLDGNNLTNYTAIHEIDVVYYKLNDAKYFQQCWLIIQCAWFFNSKYFGSHQYIDYVNHFALTGQKLPIDNYKFDKLYLEKKYEEIEKKSNSNLINGYTFVSQWYYSILYIICNEMDLPTANFNTITKDNREYNPLTQTPRQLRSLTPFKLNECDIKSAFPTFLDLSITSNLKDYVYNNLMLTKNIERNDAKILFNKICNSGKYLSVKETKLFFKSCGYSNEQCNEIIKLTHNDKKLFYSFMTSYEFHYIELFKIRNKLHRGTRLHDAILFIDDKTKPETLNIDKKCEFGFKELNRPVICHSFSLTKKQIPNAYINSVPSGLNLISKHDFEKSEVYGEANGFRFYKSKFQYISASFNCNDHTLSHTSFIHKIDVMFSTILKLNNNKISRLQISLILNNIRQNSNIVFNVRAMYLRIIRNSFIKYDIIIKKRDYELTEYLKFKTRIEFINELNKARGIVTTKKNCYDLYCLLEERINNNDYEYMNELKISGTKSNNLIVNAIIYTFNYICTGYVRKPRNTVKSKAIYKTKLKSLTLSSKSNENDLKTIIENIEKAKQLYLIVCEITGLDSNLPIEENIELQNELKMDLILKLNSYKNSIKIDSIKEFDCAYIPVKTNEIPLNRDMKNIFETDMSISIFNQISIVEANSRGEKFFQEYLTFHGLDKKEKTQNVVVQKKENYLLPEFDFDELK